MNFTLADAKEYQPLITAFVALVTFGWAVIQFLLTRSRESRHRQFDMYHRLIKDLVQGDGEATYVDRQIAAVYELRSFKDYWPLSRRILSRLDANWQGNASYHSALQAEIATTLHAIRHRWYHVKD